MNMLRIGKLVIEQVGADPVIINMGAAEAGLRGPDWRRRLEEAIAEYGKVAVEEMERRNLDKPGRPWAAATIAAGTPIENVTIECPYHGRQPVQSTITGVICARCARGNNGASEEVGT